MLFLQCGTNLQGTIFLLPGKHHVSGDGSNQLIHEQVICHCADCKRIRGSTYSVNLVVPRCDFVITAGKPIVYHKVADSGNTVSNFLCGTCGSTLWRETESAKENVIIKAGTLDDAGSRMSTEGPCLEIFTRSRVAWIRPVEGAEQRLGGLTSITKDKTNCSYIDL